GFIPADAAEALRIFLTKQRARKASQFAELRVVETQRACARRRAAGGGGRRSVAAPRGQPSPQFGGVFEQRDIQRRHGVWGKPLDPGHAKLPARRGAVVEADQREG